MQVQGTYSYYGQTPENYCVECLQRHYSKVHGLMKEGERFSLKVGKVTPEARQRVRAAIEEVVTAEEDLGTKIKEPNLAKVIDEIKVKQRDLRKWVWAKKLTTSQEDIGSLRGAIDKAKELVDLTYRAAEVSECPTCQSTILVSNGGTKIGSTTPMADNPKKKKPRDGQNEDGWDVFDMIVTGVVAAGGAYFVYRLVNDMDKGMLNPSTVGIGLGLVGLSYAHWR